MHGDVRSVTLAGVEAMSIGSGTTKYTDAFKLKQGMYFGLWYKAAGTFSLTIQLEESYTEPSANAADGNSVIPYAQPDVETAMTSTTAVVKVISPVPMTWCRFKIVNAGAGTATLNMKMFMQDTLI